MVVRLVDMDDPYDFVERRSYSWDYVSRARDEESERKKRAEEASSARVRFRQTNGSADLEFAVIDKAGSADENDWTTVLFGKAVRPALPVHRLSSRIISVGTIDQDQYVVLRGRVDTKKMGCRQVYEYENLGHVGENEPQTGIVLSADLISDGDGLEAQILRYRAESFLQQLHGTRDVQADAELRRRVPEVYTDPEKVYQQLAERTKRPIAFMVLHQNDALVFGSDVVRIADYIETKAQEHADPWEISLNLGKVSAAPDSFAGRAVIVSRWLYSTPSLIEGVFDIPLTHAATYQGNPARFAESMHNAAETERIAREYLPRVYDAVKCCDHRNRREQR
ncbi:MAG: hypothetical protein Q7R76_02335 [Candidatus Woesearchaeota archaeon]|nr:hypothetical protein [Candidatus Woesearchaeota archaeon]